MIFVSTGGRKDLSGADHSILLIDNGFDAIEVSAGRHDEFQLAKLKELRSRALISLHNYFPPPKDGFVFNLASTNKEIADCSIALVEKALHWSSELESKYYSFHAGFLLDLTLNELGKKVTSRQLVDRGLAIQLFLERVNMLAQKAQTLGIELLIENNVLSFSNLSEFKKNPFLLATPEEAVYIMNNTPNNVNLLVDVAHLFVTANSLKFEPRLFFEMCNQWIAGYHLSENDGKSDRNEPIREDSWFWKFLKPGLDIYTLEIYNAEIGLLHDQYNLTKKFLKGAI